MTNRSKSNEKLSVIYSCDKTYSTDKLCEWNTAVKEVKNNKFYQSYINKLKEKSSKAHLRHFQAAERRNKQQEERELKILAKKFKAESKNRNRQSILMLKTSTKPGVYINSVIYPNQAEGRAGFGKRYEKSETEFCLPSKYGENIINTTSNYQDNLHSSRSSYLNNDNTSLVCGTEYSKEFLTNIKTSYRGCLVVEAGMNKVYNEDTLPSYSEEFMKACENTKKETRGRVDKNIRKYTSFPTGDNNYTENDLSDYIENTMNYELEMMPSEKHVTFNSNSIDDFPNSPIITKLLNSGSPINKREILVKMAKLYRGHQMCTQIMKTLICQYSTSFQDDKEKENGNEIQFHDQNQIDKPDDHSNLRPDFSVCIVPERPLTVKMCDTDQTTLSNFQCVIPVNDQHIAIQVADTKPTSEYGCKQSGIGRFLRSCNKEKEARHSKITRLQKELMDIEDKTKLLVRKNYEYNQRISHMFSSINPQNEDMKVIIKETLIRNESKLQLFSKYLKDRQCHPDNIQISNLSRVRNFSDLDVSSDSTSPYHTPNANTPRNSIMSGDCWDKDSIYGN